MSFETINEGNKSFLVFKSWWDEGVIHGFGGKRLAVPFSIGTESFKKVHIPKQVHGKGVIGIKDLESSGGAEEADAVVVTMDESGSDGRLIGIHTADCLPIIIRRQDLFGLVHAGWRGLAAGIIGQCIARMKEDSDENGRWQVVIGPAAGPGRYEVGEEVIEALGSDAISERLSSGKHLLSLAGTASSQVERILGDKVGVFDCEICTIEDKRYYSYRREGAGTGRNLTFLGC